MALLCPLSPLLLLLRALSDCSLAQFARQDGDTQSKKARLRFRRLHLNSFKGLNPPPSTM